MGVVYSATEARDIYMQLLMWSRGACDMHGFVLSPRKIRLVTCGLARAFIDRIGGWGKAAVLASEWYADDVISRDACHKAYRDAAFYYSKHEVYSNPAQRRATRLCRIATEERISAVVCRPLGREREIFSAVYNDVVASPIRMLMSPLSSQLWVRERGNLLGMIRSRFLNDTVRSIAKTIYDDRDYAVMPVLADALADAGYGDTVRSCLNCAGQGQIYGMGQSPDGIYRNQYEDCTSCGGDGLNHVDGPLAVLEHLRSPGPHFRGCWALDLVIGRQ